MLKTKINELLDRAEAAFEKQSGWKSRDVKATIRSLATLKPTHQALMGGLVLGNTLLRGGAAEAPKRTRRAPAKPIVTAPEPAVAPQA